MKRITIFFLFILSSVLLKAQFNEGIDALNAGMYITARQYFAKQVSDSVAKPDACYYLGEIYNLTDKKDSAEYYFDMGIACPASSPLCMAGKAGLIMKSNSAEANNLIKKSKTVKAYKKNPALYVAIARAYAQNNMSDAAFDVLNIAKDMNKKYTSIYITEGDILFKLEQIGDAANKYETAIMFDNKCRPAYLKVARIYYLAKNYEQSLQYLDQLKVIDPHFAPALKLFGDLKYDKGFYSDAVPAYAEYLQSPEAGLNDQIRYAYALFFNKEYDKALAEIQQLIPKAPNNLILKRVLSYTLYELGKYPEGLEQMKGFLSLVDPADIISFDYKYYARLLSKNNLDSLSAVTYQKAIDTSDDPSEYYKEVATLYEKMKNFGKAASFYEKHMSSSKNPANSDLFTWGKDCYFAAGAIDSAAIASDSTLAVAKKTFYLKADSIFTEVINKAPTNYLGYLWRARVQSIFDPETEQGLAIPYYSKVIEILEQPDKNNKKDLIEAYQYFGYYYYVKKDKDNARIYWEKILAINPNHAVAKQALESKE